jgi:hypothetical protein
MDHRTGSAVLYGKLFGWNADGEVREDLSTPVRVLFRDSTLSGLAESSGVSDNDVEEGCDLHLDDDL